MLKTFDDKRVEMKAFNTTRIFFHPYADAERGGG